VSSPLFRACGSRGPATLARGWGSGGAMAMKWVKRHFHNARDYVERSFGRHGGAHQEAGEGVRRCACVRAPAPRACLPALAYAAAPDGVPAVAGRARGCAGVHVPCRRLRPRCGPAARVPAASPARSPPRTRCGARRGCPPPVRRGSDSGRGAAYESERPASYNTTRAIFLQLLGCTYLIAFASHFVQFEGLYGCDGILPVQQQMEMAQGLHWTLYPTLVRFHSSLGLDVYWLCNFLSVVGLVLSALAAAGCVCACACACACT